MAIGDEGACCCCAFRSCAELSFARRRTGRHQLDHHQGPRPFYFHQPLHRHPMQLSLSPEFHVQPVNHPQLLRPRPGGLQHQDRRERVHMADLAERQHDDETPDRGRYPSHQLASLLQLHAHRLSVHGGLRLVECVLQGPAISGEDFSAFEPSCSSDCLPAFCRISPDSPTIIHQSDDTSRSTSAFCKSRE